MAKMVILGAGASRACPNTDPGLPMPLLCDLPAVLTRANPKTSYHLLAQYLNSLLEKTGGDIELLLTLLYRLNESFFLPRRQYTLEAEFISQIIASSALPEVFTNLPDAEMATAILEILRKLAADNPGAAVTTFSPANFFNMFQGVLRDYFYASFQRYPCPLHLRLFQSLGRVDCLVSFNYDEIADYSLYSAGKLTRRSFEGLGFDEIILPSRRVVPAATPVPLGRELCELAEDRMNGVKFLKVHGSFNWYGRVNETGHSRDDWTYPVGSPPLLRQSIKGGPEVRYCLGTPGATVSCDNWTASPIIFPFLAKESIYRANAMFARHLVAFQHELRAVDKIILVGKSFQNADRELNGMIRYATYGKANRVLDIVDPNRNPDFESFHRSLFNADSGRRYTSFEEYSCLCGTE
nr:hypothetical protein [uncultured Paludibaculum sp.]